MTYSPPNGIMSLMYHFIQQRTNEPGSLQEITTKDDEIPNRKDTHSINIIPYIPGLSP